MAVIGDETLQTCVDRLHTKSHEQTAQILTPELPVIDGRTEADFARANASVDALRALWRSGPELLGFTQEDANGVRSQWQQAGREATQRAEATASRLYLADYRANRPPRNEAAAEAYREWAELDADDRQEALDARALEDEFERYNGPYTEEMKPFVEIMLNKRVVVRVDATRVRSWYHHKLGMDPMPLAGTTAAFVDAARS